ncbi:MAG TPA: arsenosugar biosynthesis radical SAM (seleno)protein ArsS [Casimicrobiaceae bacterium]|jgi:radical SAM/Cys-rich protein|nr:arsenosugar biosynthesis radical SAM (seleno)protein ArsS [Casimicrobiaceae bacterium]
MHATLPLLKATDFPAPARGTLDTLQVNLGYRCNQACFHCHVNASPDRKEMMGREIAELVVDVLAARRIGTLDVTGGAPELNPHFRYMVKAARRLGVLVIDRCNLTVLNEPGFEDLAEFLGSERVEVTASLPCYSKENVDKQRGENVFESSILALRKLNALGYGCDDTGLVLNLVYNPLGPSLPPAQGPLEAAYKRELGAHYGIVFNQLFTLANMPIARFGSTLVSQGKFASYMQLLRAAHNPANLDAVMCRTLVSVDWRGYLYDCDFNQMLGIPLVAAGKPRRHLSDLLGDGLGDAPISVADHCYGCTAGHGSSCGGALG